jgi:HlyD family secretion protein
VIAFAFARYRANAAKPMAHYETVGIDRGPLDAKVTATGAVSPLITVQVGSQVSGRIARLYVDFGSTVSSGQIVATIEPSLFRAAVAQAAANLASARASVVKAQAQKEEADKLYARDKALLAEGLATRTDYDVAESNALVAAADIAAGQASVAQAQATLAQAELNLKYTTITSPIDGIVISRNVDVGQTVAAALQAPTLFTIAQDLTKMQVDANVAEADVGKARAGMSVNFTVDAYPGHDFEGSVRQVRDNAQTLQNVVTYDVVIDVDNRERLLKPGMTANIVLSYAKRESSLRVPQAALRFKPDRDTISTMLGTAHAAVPESRGLERTVWLLRNGKAVPIAIQVGVNDGSNGEVLAGDVHPGDRAIVEVVKPAQG